MSESEKALVKKAYNEVLGRNPDPSGLQAYAQFLKTASYERLVHALKQSDEYKCIVKKNIENALLMPKEPDQKMAWELIHGKRAVCDTMPPEVKQFGRELGKELTVVTSARSFDDLNEYSKIKNVFEKTNDGCITYVDFVDREFGWELEPSALRYVYTDGINTKNGRVQFEYLWRHNETYYANTKNNTWYEFSVKTWRVLVNEPKYKTLWVPDHPLFHTQTHTLRKQTHAQPQHHHHHARTHARSGGFERKTLIHKYEEGRRGTFFNSKEPMNSNDDQNNNNNIQSREHEKGVEQVQQHQNDNNGGSRRNDDDGEKTPPTKTKNPARVSAPGDLDIDNVDGEDYDDNSNDNDDDDDDDDDDVTLTTTKEKNDGDNDDHARQEQQEQLEQQQNQDRRKGNADTLVYRNSCAEHVVIGGNLLSVPSSLMDVNDISQVLSLQAFDSLPHNDRLRLQTLLPAGMKRIDLQNLFNGCNVRFGNPLHDVFERMQQGKCHPRVVAYEHGLREMQRRQHAINVRNHHNNMVRSFLSMKEAWKDLGPDASMAERNLSMQRYKRRKTQINKRQRVTLNEMATKTATAISPVFENGLGSSGDVGKDESDDVPPWKRIMPTTAMAAAASGAPATTTMTENADTCDANGATAAVPHDDDFYGGLERFLHSASQNPSANTPQVYPRPQNNAQAATMNTAAAATAALDPNDWGGSPDGNRDRYVQNGSNTNMVISPVIKSDNSRPVAGNGGLRGVGVRMNADGTKKQSKSSSTVKFKQPKVVTPLIYSLQSQKLLTLEDAVAALKGSDGFEEYCSVKLRESETDVTLAALFHLESRIVPTSMLKDYVSSYAPTLPTTNEGFSAAGSFGGKKTDTVVSRDASRNGWVLSPILSSSNDQDGINKIVAMLEAENSRKLNIRAAHARNVDCFMTPEAIQKFHEEESYRYAHPKEIFRYTSVDGSLSSVGPAIRPSSSSVAKPHASLKDDRPIDATFANLVRDAAARLPHGKGNKSDVAYLFQQSQWYKPGGMEAVLLGQALRQTLDRSSREFDNCVKFDKSWIYLHGSRAPSDFPQRPSNAIKKPPKTENASTAVTSNPNRTTSNK